MKGVILAGGLGSRLYPLTYATNKHLLPVYDKPMVFYPIRTLVQAGVTEVIIVTGGPHAGDFIRVLKNGKELGLKHLEFAFQENEGGIAQALSLCEDFADGGPIAVILGDNTTDADISGAVQGFREGAMVFLREVPDPKRFGVPAFDPHDSGRIVAIEEKPAQPKSNYAVTVLVRSSGFRLYPHHRALGARRVGDHRCEQCLHCHRPASLGRAKGLLDRRGNL
jgi:glucose-1-phosphate thymidylyltransferase